MTEIAKAYDPKEIETYWYQKWTESGSFDASVDLDKEPYSIMIPPPNVTGMLHMGHVLDNTLQDIRNSCLIKQEFRCLLENS